MLATDELNSGCLPGDRVLDRSSAFGPGQACTPPNLKDLLGPAAWTRLPEAVQVRFADAVHAVDYFGEFEVVRASVLGKIIACACQILGTPVVPRTGSNVPAIVRVAPSSEGTEWLREYQWPGHSPTVVRSTKVITASGTLIEKLPAYLCMSLDVYEATGILHFVSQDYYFDIAIPGIRKHIRLVLPLWLTPGTTHVQHIDEADGWFRFTMTTTHPALGEMYFQTGRFRASGG